MKNLAEALVEVQKVITNAPTNAQNPFFKSKYTDLATAVNHCRPILAEHGLAIIQVFGGTADEPEIITKLIHVSGEFVEGRLPMKPVKSDPQSVGSLLTYGRRYSYLAMVGIAPEDDDANSAMPEKKTAPRQEPKKQQHPPQQSGDPMTEQQRKAIWAMSKKANLSDQKTKDFIAKFVPNKTKSEASDTISNFATKLSEFTSDSQGQLGM